MKPALFHFFCFISVSKPRIEDRKQPKAFVLSRKTPSTFSHKTNDDFFPERGSSTVIAKKICSECKVRKLCLEYAVERKERFGIWGGKSERERRAIRRERKKKGKQ